MSAATHVLLVGLPGAGKSTVAPLLAERLGARCVDTDAAVEGGLGMPAHRAFAELGEDRFRAEERRALEEALRAPEPLVIAAGGGLVAQPGALEAIGRRAVVVLLDAGDDDLTARIAGSGVLRPLLSRHDGGVHHLRAARTRAHDRAELHIATGARTPEEVAAAIATALQSSVRVATARPYLVRAGRGATAAVAEHLPASTRHVAVVCDRAVEATAEAIAGRLRTGGRAATVLPIAGGEEAKRWATAGSLLERCSEAGLERGDCVVAVGGGSIGDVAGFVAATYLRGVAWVVVPTTLLAMVDSAIGGKTAVNLGRGKNLAGAFWQPRGVVCDPEVLDTVPERAFRSAFAEIVKTSMLCPPATARRIEERLDAALARDLDAVTELVLACAAVKTRVVAEDEREAGLRAVLNYGHTVGHAVERLTGLGAGLDHGEAVAFGMRVAGLVSVATAGCPPADVERQDELLDRAGLVARPALSPGQIAATLGADKKARGGVPRWVLLRRRGDPVAGIVVEPEAVTSALAATLGGTR